MLTTGRLFGKKAELTVEPNLLVDVANGSLEILVLELHSCSVKDFAHERGAIHVITLVVNFDLVLSDRFRAPDKNNAFCYDDRSQLPFPQTVSR